MGENESNGDNIMYFISIGLVLFGAILTTFAGIILKKIKDVHYSIVNTVFGFIVTLIAVPAWLLYRFVFTDPVDYGFTKFQYFLMILIGILTTASN